MVALNSPMDLAGSILLVSSPSVKNTITTSNDAFNTKKKIGKET